MSLPICTHWQHPNPEIRLYDVFGCQRQPDGVSPIIEGCECENIIFSIFPKDTTARVNMAAARMSPATYPPGIDGYAHVSDGPTDPTGYITENSFLNPQEFDEYRLVGIDEPYILLDYPILLHLIFPPMPCFPIGNALPTWNWSHPERGGGPRVSEISVLPHDQTDPIPFDVSFPVWSFGSGQQVGGGREVGETSPLPPESQDYYAAVAFMFVLHHFSVGLQRIPPPSIIPALSGFALLGMLGALGYTQLTGRT